MLVLSRKVGQKIRVGEVVFEVRRLAGSRVTVGIEAPSSMRIVRDELQPLPPKTPTPEPADAGEESKAA